MSKAPDAVWVEATPTVHWASDPNPGSSPATSSTPPEPAPPAAPAAPVVAPPQEPERLSLSRDEYERDVEGRIQKALTAARKKWDGERQAEEAQRQERTQTEARERDRRHRAELAQKAAGGDEAAREELDQIAIALFGQEALEAQRLQIETAAEQTARSRIWRQHALSFGLDPESDEVVAAITGATDFTTLNRALVKLAKNEELLGDAWEHPSLKARHAAEVAKAVAEAEERATKHAEAAFLNGQATVLSEVRGPDLSGPAAGRPNTPEAIERAFADRPDDPEAIAAYRQLRRARGWK